MTASTDSLFVTIVQAPLAWEDRTANLRAMETLIAPVTGTDLILLPEMFTTGFSMNTALAETNGGETLAWMQETAAAKNAVIAGSIMCHANGKNYNRFFFVLPSGIHHTYDKRHLFTLAGEDRHYTAGGQRPVIVLKGWKIAPQICYDLRFPVWARRTEAYDYDLLIYVANWPERRNHAWKSLLIARAIENQAYVAGVNRVGNDGTNVAHLGDSAVIGPLGEDEWRAGPFATAVQTVALSKKKLSETRSQLPFFNDRDLFDLKKD